MRVRVTKPPSVLLTGGTGFIGRHLASALVARGDKITSLQRIAMPLPGVVDTIILPDLTPDALSGALSGRRFDYLYHLAGYGVRPQERCIKSMFRVNVDVTRRLVAEAESWPVRAAVVLGSGAEYDFRGVEQAVREDHPLETFNLYGASKAAGSLCALSLARAVGVSLAVARLFGVFGAGEAPHRLLPSLVRHLGRGERVPLSAGTQRRDVLPVANVIEAILAIAEYLSAYPGQLVVNVASGQTITVRAFAEIVARAVNASTRSLGFGDLSLRPDEPTFFAGDPARLIALTPWRPYKDVEESIRLAALSYRTAHR